MLTCEYRKVTRLTNVRKAIDILIQKFFQANNN